MLHSVPQHHLVEDFSAGLPNKAALRSVDPGSPIVGAIEKIEGLRVTYDSSISVGRGLTRG